MEEILAVVVLYKQRLEETNAWKSLLRHCSHVYVYDNSPASFHSSPDPLSTLDPQLSTLSRLSRYVEDPTNPGLSRAYNEAAIYAAAKGIRWLLITDQDTLFPENALEIYRRNFEQHTNLSMFLPKVRIADSNYLSPVRMRCYQARPAKTTPEGVIPLKKYAVINSGILVSTDTFLACGGYNEKVFLDFSDYQFIERYAEKYPEAYVIDMEIRQDFSNLSDSREQKLARYRLFRRSLRSYETRRPFGRLQLRLIALKRYLRLHLLP